MKPYIEYVQTDIQIKKTQSFSSIVPRETNVNHTKINHLNNKKQVMQQD